MPGTLRGAQLALEIRFICTREKKNQEEEEKRGKRRGWGKKKREKRIGERGSVKDDSRVPGSSKKVLRFHWYKAYIARNILYCFI